MFSPLSAGSPNRLLRGILLFIIVGTFPFYCAGFVLWGSAPDRSAADLEASATGDAEDATWTPIGGDVTATITRTPSPTPNASNTPINPLNPTPYQFVPPTRLPSTVPPTVAAPATDTPAPTITQVSDRDGDGIPDSQDACPDQRGVAENNGCEPDRDGDGVRDSRDQCPDVPGDALFNGCPPPTAVPDSDRDGVPDSSDACPNQPGPASNNGCPDDSDGDGIPDAEDACPAEPGIPLLNGCPEVIDSDNDGVPDTEDTCPAEPGTIANRGCPEPTPTP